MQYGFWRGDLYAIGSAASTKVDEQARRISDRSIALLPEAPREAEVRSDSPTVAEGDFEVGLTHGLVRLPRTR